jgi:uncharacterized protein
MGGDGELQASKWLSPERALALARWLIHSPPLWLRSEAISERLVDWWGCEHDNLEAWSGIPNLNRIGILAEELLGRFVENSKCLKLIKKGFAIRDEGRTLGEIDFLVLTPEGLEHWELGIKFYLLDPGSGLFIGANGRDRLDLKLSRMESHQLPLGSHPQVLSWCESEGLEKPVSKPLLKGRLFIPMGREETTSTLDGELSDGGDRGVWMFEDDLDEAKEHWVQSESSFHSLDRKDWMSRNLELSSLKEEREERQFPLNKSFQGVVMKAGEELDRVFIVPTAWPNLQV